MDKTKGRKILSLYPKTMEIKGDFMASLKRALKEIEPRYEKLNALIICGTHSPKLEELDYLLNLIHAARVSGLPYLGICYGHQLAAIEYARNVLGIKDATSEEFKEPGFWVVKKRKELNVGLHDGESYWNNYEVDLPYWETPRNFFTTQAHPEYNSSIDNPHPLLVKFMNYVKTYDKYQSY